MTASDNSVSSSRRPTSPAASFKPLTFTRHDTVLEPSFGDGSFLMPLIEKFLPLYEGSVPERLDCILTRNVYGVELDVALYDRCVAGIKQRWGYCPTRPNLLRAYFFQTDFITPFSYVIGNPPFGGTIDPALQDKLDREFGWRNGLKIKKETYSFFIVKCLNLLKPNGRLRFICSDTFLTINTMQGLRRLLLETGEPTVTRLDVFSDETKYAMVVLDLVKSGPAPAVVVNERSLPREQIALTGNHSWQITDDLARYFDGPKLGDFLVATSGMTVGANHLFVREIVDGRIVEPYEFEFFQDPITLEREAERARLGFIAPRKRAEVVAQECRGETRRNVRVVPREEPVEVALPHPDYQPYNKALNALIYAPPSHAIYWKDEGDAVLTFKKNGNWYLHGVGGGKFFGRKGLTWQLISQSLNVRRLPAGYVLDSGAPCAFLREGVASEELDFILGWTLSPLCGRLLKDVINHTKNIQGKDFERLPYPWWVPEGAKRAVIERVRALTAEARAGWVFRRTDAEIVEVGAAFESSPGTGSAGLLRNESRSATRNGSRKPVLSAGGTSTSE